MSAPPNPVCAENADLAVTESLTCFCIRDCLIPTVPAGKDRLDAWRLKHFPAAANRLHFDDFQFVQSRIKS